MFVYSVCVYTSESNRQKVSKCSVSLVHYNGNESPIDHLNQYPSCYKIISFTSVEYDFDEVNEQLENKSEKL